MSTPPVPTEDVISLLLQRQTPVNSNLNRTDALDTSDRPAGNNSQSEKEQSSSSWKKVLFMIIILINLTLCILLFTCLLSYVSANDINS